MCTNNIFDNKLDRWIDCLQGDLDGFPLGQTDGFPVGASAGVLVGNPRNTPTSTATEIDPNLGTSLFDCFAFQMYEIIFYGLSLWCSKLIELKGFPLTIRVTTGSIGFRRRRMLKV